MFYFIPRYLLCAFIDDALDEGQPSFKFVVFSFVSVKQNVEGLCARSRKCGKDKMDIEQVQMKELTMK